jgi:hypothetical protein
LRSCFELLLVSEKAANASKRSVAQKILIHTQRDYKDRAKDLLYIHDTIEVFSEILDELQKLFRGKVAPKLHPRRVAESRSSGRQTLRKD